MADFKNWKDYSTQGFSFILSDVDLCRNCEVHISILSSDFDPPLSKVFCSFF